MIFYNTLALEKERVRTSHSPRRIHSSRSRNDLLDCKLALLTTSVSISAARADAQHPAHPDCGLKFFTQIAASSYCYHCIHIHPPSAADWKLPQTLALGPLPKSATILHRGIDTQPLLLRRRRRLHPHCNKSQLPELSKLINFQFTDAVHANKHHLACSSACAPSTTSVISSDSNKSYGLQGVRWRRKEGNCSDADTILHFVKDLVHRAGLSKHLE